MVSLVASLLCIALLNLAASLALLWICIRLPEGIRRLRHHLTRKRSRRLRDHPLLQAPPEMDRREETLWRPELYD
ncbi:hypothetical protein B0E53_00117 [Micromonospora sp. MH33]|uniref:hypothetical protein n=1 Tax=Micromonospora sp. MH33 TaxID=1945509 RepID=UPI000D14B6A1|nr:hypothetical protein [Micromonospora sp. MH33]PSK67846.1 hypothetical protein B0E53_00117 [Micromonospora sp. MH33]